VNGKRQHRLRTVLRGGVAIVTLGISGVTFAGSAAADATDDYPVPHRMIITTCTAEQILAAAKDFTPIYYQRYIIDTHNRPPAVQRAAIDNAHHFYSLSPQDRRAYSEQIATNFADPMTWSWHNCANYPPDDASVWDG
jgi:hypothetical protein